MIRQHYSLLHGLFIVPNDIDGHRQKYYINNTMFFFSLSN